MTMVGRPEPSASGAACLRRRAVPPGRWPRGRSLGPNEGKSFGPEYVHNVGIPKAEAAISVHAYSPPLTAMTFYSALLPVS